MSRQCTGDFYKVKGKQYYRCSLDGNRTAIVESEGAESARCINCDRKIDAIDRGEVRTRKVVQVFLKGMLGGPGWVNHRIEKV